MTNLNEFTGDNIGGIWELKFALADEVTSIPAAVAHEITSPVVGPTWYTAYFAEGSMQVDEPDKKTDNGRIWIPLIRGFLPKDEEANKDTMEEMRLHRFILDCKDNNGKRKLYGSLESPLEFLYNLDTKEDSTGRNGHEIIWRSRDGIAHPAYFYSP